MATQKQPDFETALAELEQLVSRMESGDMKLDEALSSFEAGIKLSRDCQQALDSAEQKVQMLLEKDGELVATPLPDADLTAGDESLP